MKSPAKLFKSHPWLASGILLGLILSVVSFKCWLFAFENRKVELSCVWEARDDSGSVVKLNKVGQGSERDLPFSRMRTSYMLPLGLLTSSQLLLEDSTPYGNVRMVLEGRELQAGQGGVYPTPGRFGTITLPALALTAATLPVFALFWLGLSRVNDKPALLFCSALVLLILLKLFTVRYDEIQTEIYDAFGYIHNASNWYWGTGFSSDSFQRQPVFPLYIAFNGLIGVPLRITNELVYASACLLLAMVLRRFGFSRGWVVSAFAAMFFHPLSFPMLSRAFQDVLYAFLLIATTASFLYTWSAKTPNGRFCWSLIFGVLFGLSWNTRPENVLLAGFLIVAAAIQFVQSSLQKRDRATVCKHLAMAVAIPCMFALFFNLTFRALSYCRMGSFITYDFVLPGFSDLYSEILKIKPDNSVRILPAPIDVRLKAYAASPTFRQLQEVMEGPMLDNYAQFCKKATGYEREFGVWFFWALKFAPWHLRSWGSSAVLDRFYQQAADELKAARERGAYESRPTFGTFLDPDINNWLPYWPHSIIKQLRCLAIKELPLLHPMGSGENDDIFDAIALRRTFATKNNQMLDPDPGRIENRIKHAVVLAGRWLVLVGWWLIPAAIILLFRRAIRSNRDGILLLLPVIGLITVLTYQFSSRLILFALVDAMAFDDSYRYIFPTAPLLNCLIVVSLFFVYNEIYRYFIRSNKYRT